MPDQENMIQQVGHRSVVFKKKGTGDPLLFLHGIFVGPHHYHRLISMLAEQHEVIAPQMYGLSYDWENPVITLDQHAEFTVDFVNAAGIEPATICGHSYGGGVGMRIAPAYTAADLVLMNSLMPVEYGLGGLWGFNNRMRWKGLKEMLGIVGGARARAFIKEIGPEFSQHQEQFGREMNLTLQDMLQFRIPSEIPNPTRIYWGDKDEYFNFAMESMRRASPGYRSWHFRKLNHDWPIFTPERIRRYELKD